jgi:hypothetical protein
MEDRTFAFLYEPGTEIEMVMLFGRLMPYLAQSFAELGYPANQLYVEEYPDIARDTPRLLPSST